MSQLNEQTDNHKRENLIPTNCWGGDIVVDLELVRGNLLEVQNKVAPYKSRIIAVTKYFGLDAIVKGYEVGLRDFAESRAIQAIEKIESLPKEIREKSVFHFIGHLQTNKAEKVVEYFDYIHSVDSLKLAKVISKAACQLNKREKVLLQVNNAREEQKFGYEKEQLKTDLSQLLSLPSIEIVGLMNMAPLGASDDELRELFAGLRQFRDELESEFDIQLPELSMGMSNDYERALEQGSTMVRIGRKLFK